MSNTIFDSCYLNNPDACWSCINCSICNPSDSFFEDSQVLEGNEYGANVVHNTTSTSLSGTEWFNMNINDYYKNNLKIGHLNVNV